MPLNEKQREILQSDNTLGREFREYITQKGINIFYNASREEGKMILSERLYRMIKKIFAENREENMSKELYDLIGKHNIAMIQSLCVYFFGNATFKYETLKEFCDKYNIHCDSFKNKDIKISTFIEAYFFTEMKKALKEKTGVNAEYHFINPEGFGEMYVYFSEIESMLRTKQKHCDGLIEIGNDLREIIVKAYIDMKTYGSFNTESCRFTLIHLNSKTVKRYLNDIVVGLKNYIEKNNVVIEDPIHDVLNDLKKIHLATDIAPMEKFEQMLTIILNMFIDPKFQHVNLSFAVNTGYDKDYEIFFKNYVEPLKKKINIKADLINKMMPLKNEINCAEHKATIEAFLDEMLPPVIKEKALEYVKNIILPQINP